MEPEGNTTKFIEDLQRFFGRSLSFPREVGLIIDQCNAHGLSQPFRDALFHAKFATKTREVMSRIGAGAEGFDKLSTEFQVSVEKVTTLLKTVVKESPDEIKQHFVDEFFSLDEVSFTRLMKLLEDLSWVKNWEVDGKPLPISEKASRISRPAQPRESLEEGEKKQTADDLSRFRSGAAFGFVLMMLLFCVDPPVTLLGWGLAIVVVMLLFYIALASHSALKKTQSPH